MSSNSVCRHTSDEQIRPLCSNPILLITHIISNGNWIEWNTIQGVYIIV